MNDKRIFIYKEKNTTDRDCVKYIETERLNKLECGHYFPRVSLTGACFSCDFDIGEIDYENITTILTKKDFEKLGIYNERIEELGYGLDKQPNKIELGHKYYKDIEPIIAKLLSKDNEELFLQVQAEEKEFIKKEWNLTDREIKELFDYITNDLYSYDYRDRAVVCAVYEDYEELGETQFENYNENISEYLKNYIDYERFGEDLVEQENFVELGSGRIVEIYQ